MQWINLVTKSNAFLIFYLSRYQENELSTESFFQKNIVQEVFINGFHAV